MAELVRAFVAVRVPGKAADELENFLAQLRPLAPIRWVRREQFHITLKFLGEVEPAVIEQVKDALEPVKYFEPFRVGLEHIGAFPNLSAPKVLWLGGEKGAHELGRLAEKVNEACEEAGIEREKKKFRAHMTLARLKEGVLAEGLVRRLGEVPAVEWECGELVLMRSQLTPRGPVYSQLL